MKLGPVTKLYKRSKATSKKLTNEITENEITEKNISFYDI